MTNSPPSGQNLPHVNYDYYVEIEVNTVSVRLYSYYKCTMYNKVDVYYIVSKFSSY